MTIDEEIQQEASIYAQECDPNCDNGEMFKGAIKGFKEGASWALKKTLTWIPIEEGKLPPEIIPILVLKDDGEMEVHRAYPDKEFVAYEFEHITHWRPINNI